MSKEFNSVTHIDRLRCHVDKLLKEIGKEKAKVTDETEIGKLLTKKGVEKLSKKLNFLILPSDLVWQVAQYMRATTWKRGEDL